MCTGLRHSNTVAAGSNPPRDINFLGYRVKAKEPCGELNVRIKSMCVRKQLMKTLLVNESRVLSRLWSKNGKEGNCFMRIFMCETVWQCLKVSWEALLMHQFTALSIRGCWHVVYILKGMNRPQDVRRCDVSDSGGTSCSWSRRFPKCQSSTPCRSAGQCGSRTHS